MINETDLQRAIDDVQAFRDAHAANIAAADASLATVNQNIAAIAAKAGADISAIQAQAATDTATAQATVAGFQATLTAETDAQTEDDTILLALKALLPTVVVPPVAAFTVFQQS